MTTLFLTFYYLPQFESSLEGQQHSHIGTTWEEGKPQEKENTMQKKKKSRKGRYYTFLVNEAYCFLIHKTSYTSG